jgi:hypothetical protein
MSAVDTKFYEKKKSSAFYGALAFLLLVLAISAGLFVYNGQLQEQNTQLEAKILQIENSIKDLEQDPSVQAYSIYERHEAFLQKLSEQSKIPSFVSHLKKYFAIHGLEAKGFNYSQGTVRIDLSAQTNDSGYAYQKVVKFVREYNLL